MNKRLLISESRDDLNRCTPCRGNPTNTIRTLPTPVHVCLAYASYGQSLYVAIIHESSTDLNRSTAREKKGSRHNPQHTNWSICGSVPSFSHRTASEAVGKIQASVDDKLLDLLDPYHQHAISTFNTCSRGLTHRSLTNTGGGYNLEGVDFPHTTHRPSQSAIFPFHLRAPHSLRLSINSLPCELKGDQTLNLTSGSLHSTSAVTCHLSTAWANDVPLR
jgi:hypothetical protein